MHGFIEIIHSCTPKTTRKEILNCFQHADESICLLVATIVFCMGMNCKGVRTIVYFGPSKNVESYIQETVRAGRRIWDMDEAIFTTECNKEVDFFHQMTEMRRMH